MVPADWLGKGQLLYLVFLWWMVIGNFDRAQVAFAPQRLVTEGLIHLNAVICTAMVLMCARGAVPLSFEVVKDYRPLIRRAVVMGAARLAVSVLLQWGIVRAVYGDQFAGYSGKHIRFGPSATARNKKPVSGQPHP